MEGETAKRLPKGGHACLPDGRRATPGFEARLPLSTADEELRRSPPNVASGRREERVSDFFDTYVDDTPKGSDEYVSGTEKDALLASGESFTITGVKFDPKGGYENADRYVLNVILEGVERKLSFQAGSVDSRDRMLASMAEFLSAEAGRTVNARLEASGRATLITAAA